MFYNIDIRLDVFQFFETESVLVVYFPANNLR